MFLMPLLFFLAGSVTMLILTLIISPFSRVRQREVEELNRELIARNDTLERYDKMKSEFLATVAHEINTPLAVIAACSNDTLDLLKETAPNLDEIKENQEIIERRVKLVDGVLLDLMDTVAIETGRLSLSREAIDLAELIKSFCSNQFKQMDCGGNSLEFNFPKKLPHIWVDPLRIEQVMTNLLSNACTHTIDGVITVSVEQKDGSQIVSVADTGAGMDEDMAQAALKLYSSTKADNWRHGIGLYLCRRVISAHGGTFHIESELGKGTTVSFSIREDGSGARF